MDDLTAQEQKERWHNYFLGMAEAACSISKDSSTRVGAVIIGPDREIRATGFNGMPRHVLEHESLKRDEAPVKYLYTEHAERNAIYQAARTGVSIHACTMYVWASKRTVGICADCARAIIQAGITLVITNLPFDHREVRDVWMSSVEAGSRMMSEARVGLYTRADPEVRSPHA